VRALAGLALLALAGCGGGATQDPPPAAARPRFEAMAVAGGARASQLASGERLSRVLGCRGCHGADLRGQPWEEDADLAISFSSNLTRALPVYSDAQIERAMRGGVRADGTPLWGMPSEIFTDLDPADLAALIAYLRTLTPGGIVHPRIVFGPRGRRDVASGAYRAAPDLVRARHGQGPPRLDGRHELARYIARATCGECHGIELKWEQWPPGEPSPPDLIVAGAYSRAQFHQLMRTGEPPGGRRLRLMDEVARGRFAHLTEREVDAVYDYLIARANAPQ
jgi:cytochrome c553